MEEEMDTAKTLNHNLATIGWGVLLIWWGIVIMVGPLTIGMGAIGTGLICLGVNAVRSLRGIPTKGSTTVVGIIALAWGILDTLFNPRFELSFALMLIIIGVVTLGSLLMRPATE
jgi:hypothetical protein